MSEEPLRKATGTEGSYRAAQEETGHYLDLIREFLEADVAHLISTGKFDKAIESRFGSLVALGKLDRDIKRGLDRAKKRSGRGLFAGAGWLVPFALGIVVASVPFLLASWTRESPGESLPSRLEAQVPPEDTAGTGDSIGAPDSGGEVLDLEATPGQVLALFDSKYPADTAWFGRILSGLRPDASDELEQEIGRWLAGESFDTTRVRSGMALWILAGNGWPLHIDGLYGTDCTGTNCPTMRNAWVSALDLDVSNRVPSLPLGTAWRDPAVALAPFEKFLIVQHILQSSPDG